MWKRHGFIPKFHIVTEQIVINHDNRQLLTIFSQVNFDQNKFEIVIASDNGNTGDFFEWTYIYKECTDIANFHVKSAVMIKDNLVITARGKPRDTFEQCISFLLIMKAQINEGLIAGFDPGYNYIKLDHLVYPQLNSTPVVDYN
jgi:hypothetical protein